MHRVGPAESGQVTSVVRYEPGATFPPHDHPGGEEILVLEGVFSDEHGDWPAGTYLLNPEGFRHAPFSRDGCVLWVKLRQYPGANRLQLQLNSNDLDWLAGPISGISARQLYEQAGYTERMRLEKWQPETSNVVRRWDEGVEIFVLRGSLQDDDELYDTGTWLRLPPGSEQQLATTTGCEVYIKEGGFTYLLQG